ncbi:hypothetical protein OG439_40705 [Amycolatopsis sp. NBC_01307]|uniref:hypothetical protein n=1 Tax=Amycolatopsis sp. NBC_01307 TaxID=2903561 RepID=UPI002E1494DE|nr:hypothetical protein OG439_40705 [Amycolatopsis sp. NBC_01307]
MGDVLADVATYGFSSLLLTAVLCGFFPVFVLRLLLLLYPAAHERRTEWLTEIAHVPYRERLIWVMALIPTAFFEAIPERVRQRRTAKQNNNLDADRIELEAAIADLDEVTRQYVQEVESNKRAYMQWSEVDEDKSTNALLTFFVLGSKGLKDKTNWWWS